jgi:hypothetical protein
MQANQLQNLELLISLLQNADQADLYNTGEIILADATEDEHIILAEVESLLEEKEEVVVEEVVSEETSEEGTQDVLQEYVEAVLMEVSSGRFNTQISNLEIINLNVGNSLDDAISDSDRFSSYNVKFNSSALLSVLVQEQQSQGGASEMPQFEQKIGIPGGGNGGAGTVTVAWQMQELDSRLSPTIDLDDVLDNVAPVGGDDDVADAPVVIPGGGGGAPVVGGGVIGVGVIGVGGMNMLDPGDNMMM